MKDKTLRNIKICCYIALASCFVWACLMVRFLIIDLFKDGMLSHSVNWSENTAMKVIVLSCYLLGSVAMIALCVKAVFNVLKGIRDNTVFPRSNEKLMFWIALTSFMYMLSWSNIPVLFQEDFAFCFSGANLIIPFFLLFFAFMYKVAAGAVEENNLTI